MTTPKILFYTSFLILFQCCGLKRCANEVIKVSKIAQGEINIANASSLEIIKIYDATGYRRYYVFLEKMVFHFVSDVDSILKADFFVQDEKLINAFEKYRFEKVPDSLLRLDSCNDCFAIDYFLIHIGKKNRIVTSKHLTKGFDYIGD